MQSLKWTRRKVTVPFLNTEVQTTEHVAVHAMREYALRKVDDLFFLYIDGNNTGRIFFHTLKAGKAAVEKVTVR